MATGRDLDSPPRQPRTNAEVPAAATAAAGRPRLKSGEQAIEIAAASSVPTQSAHLARPLRPVALVPTALAAAVVAWTLGLLVS